MNKQNELLNTCLPALIRWYDCSRRELPWRNDPSPYHVWLSEIMLQQTRIEAVIPYYHRFLAHCPDIFSLAEADEALVLKLWEGLGYYTRARNLMKTAKILVSQYKGVFPKEAAALKKLPGIGDYTAGAISSIAYGQPEPAVDGNVLRVISRILASEADIQSPATKKQITQLLRACYPKGKGAALLTEGIMELGETLCIPNGEPRCEHCPLEQQCLAHLQHSTDRIPVKAAPKERRIQPRTVFLLCRDGKYAVRRRPENGLLSGLWEFPGVDGHLCQEDAFALLRSWGLSPISCRQCPPKTHIFTHVEWHMIAYRIECTGPDGDFSWYFPENIRQELSVPTAFRQYQKLIESKY